MTVLDIIKKNYKHYPKNGIMQYNSKTNSYEKYPDEEFYKDWLDNIKERG
jgi:hypothetical protein